MHWIQALVGFWSGLIDFIRDSLPHGLVIMGAHMRSGDESLGKQARRLLASSVVPLLVGAVSAYVGIVVGVARIDERLKANAEADVVRQAMIVETRKMLMDHINDFERFKEAYYNHRELRQEAKRGS